MRAEQMFYFQSRAVHYRPGKSENARGSLRSCRQTRSRKVWNWGLAARPPPRSCKVRNWGLAARPETGSCKVWNRVLPPDLRSAEAPPTYWALPFPLSSASVIHFFAKVDLPPQASSFTFCQTGVAASAAAQTVTLYTRISRCSFPCHCQAKHESSLCQVHVWEIQ